NSEQLGGAELTPLGQRIELLRIGRGLRSQHLARFAGTSRQQLWRVMTGKSDLTEALRQRLAQALEVEASALTTAPAGASIGPSAWAQSGSGTAVIGISLETYLAAPAL